VIFCLLTQEPWWACKIKVVKIENEEMTAISKLPLEIAQI
jgi:hypothetical protein